MALEFDDPEPEDPDDDDDSEDGDDDDGDDGDDGDDDGNGDEVEDRGRAAPDGASADRSPAPSEPAHAQAASVASTPQSPPVYRSEAPRAARVGTWLPLSDDRVGYVLVYRAGQSGNYLCRIIRPFPTVSLERWLLHSYGPGRYRLLQRGRPPERAYLGSLTVTVTEAHGQGFGATVSEPHANGNGTVSVPRSPSEPTQVPPGTDYRLALVTVGLPLLAGAVSEFAKAMASRPPRTELTELLAVAKLLQTPNEERTALFRDGIKLYREIADSVPRSGEGGDLFNMRDLLAGVGELLRSWRAGAPASSSPAPTHIGPPAVPLPAPPAGELQAVQGETPENFVERVIVTEIQRAVGTGDSPECLVILIESWLPSHVVQWLEGSPDEEVLEELPKRFPAHSDYLKQAGVQQFLRSALQLLREDPEGEEVERVREPALAGAGR